MADTVSQTVLFPDLFDKPLVATFDQQHASSDGGAVLLKAAERQYGLIDGFAECLVDDRQPGKVRHTLADLLGQRIFGIACGHPDGNDGDRLADDPIHKLLLGRDPITGDALASQPTIQDRWGHERASHPPWDATGRPARQVEPQRAVHAMHALMVPGSTLEPQAVITLPEAPAWVPGHDVGERRDHGRIPTMCRHRRPIVRRPRQVYDLTGPSDWQLMFPHQHLGDLSFRGRRYNFRAKTSLIAAFSNAKSAYICFSFAFSPSSSRRRFTSATDAPAYLLRHLKNVVRLMPCCRRRSATGTPDSASLRIPTIWLSLNFDFLMTAPLSREPVYLRVSTEGGSLRLHLIVDSPGLSIVGEGEWAAATHGGRGRRGWRKLHLGVDGSRVIVAWRAD